MTAPVSGSGSTSVNDLANSNLKAEFDKITKTTMETKHITMNGQCGLDIAKAKIG